MRSRLSGLLAAGALLMSTQGYAANTASGSVDVQKVGVISPKFSAGYLVRDQRNARTTQTEILLSEVTIDPAAMQGMLDPHMVAINLDALRDRNYILLFIRADGWVGMNATFSKGMTQFLNDTTGGLKAEFTARTATRIEAHVFSPAPLKTMDGTTYTVDLRFGVDVAAAPVGTPLPAGGGDAGKALTAFLAASQKKNWAAIKSGSEPRRTEDVRQELQHAGRERRERGGFAQGVDSSSKNDHHRRAIARQHRDPGCRGRALPGPARSLAGADGEERNRLAVRSGGARGNGTVNRPPEGGHDVLSRCTEFRTTSRSINS